MSLSASLSGLRTGPQPHFNILFRRLDLSLVSTTRKLSDHAEVALLSEP